MANGNGHREVYAREWSAKEHVSRATVDLSGFPDLVVMYLGMRLNRPSGVATMMRFRRAVDEAVKAKPDGLLLHERLVWGFAHVGMRQYWRDFESLEKWARSEPHRAWWTSYLKHAGGTGFWHETYFMRGGFEAIYDAVDEPIGLLRFAPVEPADGGMFSARRRLLRQAAAARAEAALDALPEEPADGA